MLGRWEKTKKAEDEKVGKYNDNDKEKTTTAPLNFSASQPPIF